MHILRTTCVLSPLILPTFDKILEPNVVEYHQPPAAWAGPFGAGGNDVPVETSS
jgi:hypothetical protein